MIDLAIKISNQGRCYISNSNLDEYNKVDTGIDKIIDEVNINFINRILDPNKYTQYLLHGIKEYLIRLQSNGIIFYFSEVSGGLIYDEYSFKLSLSFTYTVYYGQIIEFKREISSSIDDMFDRCQSNTNIKLKELFKKYDNGTI
jgi:hypothetical protein